MSKIQDALNKLKAADSASLSEDANRSIVPSNTTGRSLNKAGNADILSMREPLLRTPEEIARLRLIDARMSDGRVLNAFREIRTTILRNVSVNQSVIMVVPVVPDSGASFVALNLAVSFSLEEDKTSLVVDCDLRHPTIHRFAIHEGEMLGLRDYLTKPDIDVADIIYPSGIPRLRVLPAGNEEVPLGEYFTTARLRSMMSELKMRYPERYIFIDAPPISISPDARILADVSDHVILVVPHAKSTELQIDAAIEAVGEDRLLGVIFNNTPQLPRFGW